MLDPFFQLVAVCFCSQSFPISSGRGIFSLLTITNYIDFITKFQYLLMTKKLLNTKTRHLETFSLASFNSFSFAINLYFCLNRQIKCCEVITNLIKPTDKLIMTPDNQLETALRHSLIFNRFLNKIIYATSH